MRRLARWFAVAIASIGALAASQGWTQQVTTQAPFSRVGNSFFENSGTSWGGNFRGIRFQGLGQAAPAFGNPNSSGGRVGVGWNNRSGSGYFNAHFGQGSSREMVGQTPMVTTMNGQPGTVSDTSQSPFVIGTIPVVGGHVGGFPAMVGVSPVGIPGSTVQLPTWSVFGTSTTVSVPDRGNALLGGVNRAASGANQFGVPGLPGGNRSSGSQTGAASQRVSVTVHNVQEMDAALLAGAASSTPPPPDPGRQALAASRTSSAGQAVPSVADARRQHEAEQNAKRGEALGWLEKAQKAEQEGKPGVAKAYYQMVARRTSGDLHDRAMARLEALRSASSASVVQSDGR